MESIQRASGGRLNPAPITQVARQTPVPATIKHAQGRERVTQEPSRTGRDQQRTYEQQRPATPAPQQPPLAAPRPGERLEQRPPQQTVPAVPQRPPVQTVPPPTGWERGYRNREPITPPPAQVAPPREQPSGRSVAPAPQAPPPEKERGRDKDDRDKP